jgi:hypothetical protein
VTQGVSPEFKPQYSKKKKKRQRQEQVVYILFVVGEGEAIGFLSLPVQVFGVFLKNSSLDLNQLGY